MALDPSLAGHETQPEVGTVSAEDIARFADAIGDGSPIYRDEAAAQSAGYARIPAPPTFVTRFRVPFAEAGLDVTRMQVLHGEQEYSYTRPLARGAAVSVRHRIASLRQSGGGGMAIMVIEQLCDTPAGERLLIGRSKLIVRDAAPGGEAVGAGAEGARSRAREPAGEAILALVKHITQAQINAYADVSGDHNPIHLDPAAARAVGLEGTIAHGMLSMAFAGQLITDWLTPQPKPGGALGRLRVRFQAMVRPGDTLTCRGVLGTRVGERRRIELWIDNQHGERVTTGDADILDSLRAGA